MKSVHRGTLRVLLDANQQLATEAGNLRSYVSKLVGVVGGKVGTTNGGKLNGNASGGGESDPGV